MDAKDDMEDGEISDISDGDGPLGHYTPLERPVTAKAVLPQSSNDGKDNILIFLFINPHNTTFFLHRINFIKTKM